MVSETSSVSSPTFLAVIPSRSLSSIFSKPTGHSNSRILQPRVNQISGCCANKVIINLSTALVIPDYSLYYTEPIDSFQPTFHALDDGSLIAPPLADDLYGANVSLLVTGMLTMLFVRNILVSGDYLRRGRVKRKTLFYTLFLSQILAPISLVPIIMSSFTQSLNCTVVIVLSCVTGTVSLALLITGILGVKAYKCLNNSRLVLIVLALFQCASIAIVAIDVSAMRGERRLSGSCVRVGDLLCTRIFIWIQLVESLFICSCFFYACWKSRRSSSARGRISIQLSMDDLPIEVPEDIHGKKPTLRGWWDYVSDDQTAAVNPQVLPHTVTKPPVRKMRSRLIGFFDQDGRKPPLQRSGDRTEKSDINSPEARGISPAPSTSSRLGKLVPNIHLFQKVIKDELLYTTFITATCVVVAVLAVIGLNFKNGLTVSGWIALNWGVISLLAIHSFGRVVRRHEREALLHYPFICDAKPKLCLCHSTPGDKKPRDPKTPKCALSDCRPEARDVDLDDPFSDTRRLSDSRSSWGSDFCLSANPPSLDLFDEHYRINAAISNPFIRYSGSGHSTPRVPHGMSDGPLILGLSEAWFVERASSPVNEGDKSDQNMRT